MAHHAHASVSISEFGLNWPGGITGSTHELVMHGDYIYVTGQNMNQVAKCNLNGQVVAYFKMPERTKLHPDGSETVEVSGPHGILFDKHGKLWVSLEFFGLVVQLDQAGKIVKQIDVRMLTEGASAPINPAPHGIGLASDGETIWFTGKRTSTIGKINPNGSVQHFQLNNLAAMPIFLSGDHDGGIWGTELLGSAILHVSRDGQVREFSIPTGGSRPIGIIPDPSGKYMWFTEEAGVKIGRIDQAGHITEYPVPTWTKSDILGSLAFDPDGNLWVQIYYNHASGGKDQPQTDGLIKIDKSIVHAKDGDISGVPFQLYAAPSKGTMMHRIRPDAKGNLWFTEMMTDILGRVSW
jgi:virginiamycin B lyase